MSNNVYFIHYHFNIIPFKCNSNIVGCFINRRRKNLFWSTSRQIMMSISFKMILHNLILVFSFETFFSTFVKMTDFQGVKDFSDIFLSDNNFPLTRLSMPSKMLSLFFFQFMVFSLICIHIYKINARCLPGTKH